MYLFFSHARSFPCLRIFRTSQMHCAAPYLLAIAWQKAAPSQRAIPTSLCLPLRMHYTIPLNLSRVACPVSLWHFLVPSTSHWRLAKNFVSPSMSEHCQRKKTFLGWYVADKLLLETLHHPSEARNHVGTAFTGRYMIPLGSWTPP